jgi:hypothetical protein
MKECVVMVGPMGSGKTTVIKNLYPNHVRVSQDELGSVGHMQFFEEMLKRGKDIVVDRCGFNREQRSRYLKLAKEHGYQTLIRERFEGYETCFNRVLNREGHPTIPKGDAHVAMKALDMYWSQYEPIRYTEADVVFPSITNPLSMDLGYHFYNGKRFIIIGDLHGCFTDLMNLLKKVNYNMDTDIVVLCGDMVDRGPQIDMVLTWFINCPNVYSVRGNHDDKFIRYLKGNKVHPESLSETIKQTQTFDKLTLYRKLVDLPYVITFDKYAITHAGFHPEYETDFNSREFALYARKYDPTIRTFTNDNSKPYWYEYTRKNDYMADMPETLFFGHEIHPDVSLVKKTDTEEIYALDAGCYMGGKLRAAVVDPSKHGVEIVEVDSTQPKTKKQDSWDHMNKFEPYDKLVEQGYLNKQEQGDLVLYNYTDLCTYDKNWNKYTLESRGLILNKVTGDTVARPFPKFFNLGENQNVILSKMPNEPYSCYEKVDGSLGILYRDPADNSWKIATRGSFQSEQAKIATGMFNNVPEYEFASHAERWEAMPVYHEYTLLFEIIYPENRVNPGARLVCDYGSTRTLILLGGINKVSGKDLSYETLEEISEMIKLPLVKKFDYTIEEMIELKKTLPATEEGFVVKYDSGFRVKIKGDEYCKMQRILNSISPLFIWELMKETPTFYLKDEYLLTIPEEILPEVKEMEAKLQLNAKMVMTSIRREYVQWKLSCDALNEMDAKAQLKSLGLWCQNPDNNVSHKGAMFLWHKKEHDKVMKYVILTVRPKANVI